MRAFKALFHNVKYTALRNQTEYLRTVQVRTRSKHTELMTVADWVKRGIAILSLCICPKLHQHNEDIWSTVFNINTDPITGILFYAKKNKR